MIVLEAALAAIILLLLVSTSAADLKTGKIPNRTIMTALVPGILAMVPYYVFFASDCFPAYAVNNLLGLVISLMLYASGIWGAGDCKLLSTVVFLYPARLYCLSGRSIASCFSLISLIFIAAFVYVIGETLWLGIRRRDLFRHSRIHIDIRSYLRGFLFYYFFLNLSNGLLVRILPPMLLEDAMLLTAIHFVLVLLAMRLEPRVSWRVIILMAAAWGLMLLTGLLSLSLSGISWKPYILVIVLIGFRAIADKYNYQTLEVTELKPGMILSLSAVMAFRGSRVQGLPVFSSEDLKSRLTPAEVESIQRWSKTKTGSNTVVIVRKMPFALFITAGTVLFTVLEVLAS